MLAGVALASGMLASGSAWAQPTFPGLPTEPGTDGDQLVYFYDTRPNRVTFLTIGNTSVQNSVLLELVYYSQSLDTRIAETTLLIPGGGAVVVDPTKPEAGGNANVAGTAGLLIVTPITSDTDHTPIVPPTPLVGGFSIVNTKLGAGFGDSPFGRIAVDSGGAGPGAGPFPRAAAGTAVDGATVFYQVIQPRAVEPSLTLPVYLNPNSLGSPDDDGNRILLASIRDQYAAPVGPGSSARFNVTPVTVNATVSFFSSGNGQRFVTNRAFSVNAVALKSLQEISGGTTFTSSGRLEMTVPAFGALTDSFFGTSGQSLGTFAFGQRLVAVDVP